MWNIMDKKSQKQVSEEHSKLKYPISDAEKTRMQAVLVGCLWVWSDAKPLRCAGQECRSPNWNMDYSGMKKWQSQLTKFQKILEIQFVKLLKQ